MEQHPSSLGISLIELDQAFLSTSNLKLAWNCCISVSKFEKINLLALWIWSNWCVISDVWVDFEIGEIGNFHYRSISFDYIWLRHFCSCQRWMYNFRGNQGTSCPNFIGTQYTQHNTYNNMRCPICFAIHLLLCLLLLLIYYRGLILVHLTLLPKLLSYWRSKSFAQSLLSLTQNLAAAQYNYIVYKYIIIGITQNYLNMALQYNTYTQNTVIVR